jgi:hypothetical protein
MENILINIDSRFRNKTQFPNPAKFTYKLNKQIKDVTYIKITSIEIPNLYHTFTRKKDNVSFVFTVSGVNYNVNIPEGFYTSISLLEAIQSDLNVIPGAPMIKLNLASGIISLESDQPFTLNFANTTKYPSLGYHLGFRKNTYTSKVGTNYYLFSESQLDVIGDNYLFLKVNDYGKIYNFNDYDGITKYENINAYLAKVIMNVNKTEKVFDNSNFLTKTFMFRQPTNIESFNVELIDPYKETVELVQMDFSFTIEIGVIFNSITYSSALDNNLENPKIINHFPNHDTINENENKKELTCDVESNNNFSYLENKTEINKLNELEDVNKISFNYDDSILKKKSSKRDKNKSVKKGKSKKDFSFNY